MAESGGALIGQTTLLVEGILSPEGKNERFDIISLTSGTH